MEIKGLKQSFEGKHKLCAQSDVFKQTQLQHTIKNNNTKYYRVKLINSSTYINTHTYKHTYLIKLRIPITLIQHLQSSYLVQIIVVDPLLHSLEILRGHQSIRDIGKVAVVR